MYLFILRYLRELLGWDILARKILQSTQTLTQFGPKYLCHLLISWIFFPNLTN